MMKIMRMKNIIIEAEKLALSEIEKYGYSSKFNFDTGNKRGLELAKRLDVNTDIVQIGTRLMDIGLGKAHSEGRISDHIDMSVEITENFLSRFNLTDEVRKKIINCVEGHHGTVKWICKEAEICANADCYRFIQAKNVFLFIMDLAKEGLSFDETVKLVKAKLEEKYKILSLDICKKELEEDYKVVKRFLSRVK